MTGAQKALIGCAGTLLMAFVVFGIYTWVRVIETIPYSSSCATTLVQISRQSAMARPFFLGSFIIGVVAFELSRRQLSKSWRYIYLITLGLGAALLIAPWLVDLFYS
jgi:hypothetical protein